VAPELLPVPPSKGGAIERWVRDAATCLAARGHDVHVVSRDHGDGRRDVTADGVRYHYVRIPRAIDRGLAAVLARGLWYYTGVARVLSRIAPDIVHHHSRPGGLLLSRRGAPGARQIISLHSMDYGWGFAYAGWDRRLAGRAFSASARVLCVSEFIRRHTIERYPEAARVATTVYNGVDGRTFHPGEARNEPHQTILYVGRVEARKGVHVLLDAFERSISPSVPEARLRIVGPHSYWDLQPSAYYEEVVARCEAHPQIELRGPTYVDTELAEIYRSADVAVVPSVFPEALGLTAIEAQASGVAVVVSDAGGLPETVSPGDSGLVFENGSADQLAAGVLELLKDGPRRTAMAGRARQWAMSRFSWDVIAATLEGVYLEALASPARGTAP
jgi:spore coat protein SA